MVTHKIDFKAVKILITVFPPICHTPIYPRILTIKKSKQKKDIFWIVEFCAFFIYSSLSIIEEKSNIF